MLTSGSHSMTELRGVEAGCRTTHDIDDWGRSGPPVRDGHRVATGVEGVRLTITLEDAPSVSPTIRFSHSAFGIH